MLLASWIRTRMRTLRSIFLVVGGIALFVLVYRLGADSIASALTHVTWWQFVLVCLLQGLNVVIDACAWRYALTGAGAPFHRLVAARLAGDAVNVLSALASVGGEAVKGWVLRRGVPYGESVA